VNFGPHGEKNRAASGADTVYADQKTGLLPKEFWSDEALGLPKRDLSALRPDVLEKIEKNPELRASYERVVPYLTPDEAQRIRPAGAASLQKLINDVDAGKIAHPEELAEMAQRGSVKRGWYQHSAEALVDVFEADAPRFGALLASLSPQTGVEANLTNTLKMWKNWNEAGRPTDAATIKRILGESVQGGGTEASVLNAWFNNSVRSLTHPDPRNLQLSGPKVNSFAGNLRGLVDEVTNDTWQAEAIGVTQRVFNGANLKGLDPKGVRGKGIGYLFSTSLTRNAAEILTRETGVKWSPAEVQETVWSFVKTVMEKRSTAGSDFLHGDMNEIIANVTDAEISGTPDFASLLPTGEFGETLRQAGYGKRLGLLSSKPKTAIPVGKTFRSGRIGAIAARLERQHQAGKEQAVRGASLLRSRKDAGFASRKLLAGVGGLGLLGAWAFSGRKSAEDAKKKNQQLNSRTERALREMGE
jgi:hypothetical protein